MKKSFELAWALFIVSILTCFSPIKAQNIDKIDASKLKNGKHTLRDKPINDLVLTVKVKNGSIRSIKAKRQSTGRKVKITKIAPNYQSCIGPNEFCLTIQTVICYTWGGVCFCSCGGFIFYPHSNNN